MSKYDWYIGATIFIGLLFSMLFGMGFAINYYEGVCW